MDMGYEQEFYHWLEQNIQILKTGRFEELDRANLIHRRLPMTKEQIKSAPSLMESQDGEKGENIASDSES